MKVLIVKDGTVPLVVTKVLAADWQTELVTEDLNRVLGDETDRLEVFDVDGEPEALDVTWAEDMGFTVYGTTIETWMRDRQVDDCGGPIEVVNGRQGELHLVQSDICHGEDEQWYSHLFVIA